MPASQSLNLLLTCNILTGLHNKEDCKKSENHFMINTENMHWTIGCAKWERITGLQKQKSSTEIINREGERV